MLRFLFRVRYPALLLALAALWNPGLADGANLHVIIAADTSPQAGLGGDVVVDKKSIKRLFEDHVPAAQLRLQVVKEPLSTQNIVQAVNGLRVTAQEDSIVFYYTGHGAYDEAKGHFFDLAATNQQLLRRHLKQALIKHEPRTAVLITDCCAAGAKFKGNVKAVHVPANPRQISPLLKHLLFDRCGIIDITSSKPGEVSLTRGDGKGSLFTYPFVTYLDKNSQKILSWDKIIGDVKATVQSDFDRVTKKKGVDTDGDRSPDQFTQTVYPFVLTPTLGMRVKFQNGNLVITEVLPLSPAFHAGLEVGDHLLEINGQPLPSEQAYSTAVDNSPRKMVLKVHDPDKGINGTPTAILNP